MTVKILLDTNEKRTYNPVYDEIEEPTSGYACGCGGDEHDDFAMEYGCECYCHK